MKNTFKIIKKDKQIMKFCFYGFLKNLKFFEPFLVIYLLDMNLSLFKIGFLYSIREIVNYIFEIPSGIFADNYGKKTELCFCFIMYIISFVFFYIGKKFIILSIAMIFFGMGEAFRSGTHKAMIYSYLETKNWFKYKGFVYGRTRSFSLLGSSISSFISIIFILRSSNLRILFILCIIPYLLDFLLILSYPNNLNEKIITKFNFKEFLHKGFLQIKNISFDKNIIKITLSSSIFDAIFRSVKDYIQPVIKTLILTSSLALFKNLNPDNVFKLYLSIIYGFIYIFSSIASKNIYKLNRYLDSSTIMNIQFTLLSIIFILFALSIKMKLLHLIVFLYLVLYIIKDSRKPVFVDVIGDFMQKEDRATILSIESQFRSLFLAILSPILGLIADIFSISTMFLLLGIISLILNKLLTIPKIKNTIVDKL